MQGDAHFCLACYDLFVLSELILWDAYREMRIFVLCVTTCLFYLNWFYNIRMWYMRRFPKMRITNMRKIPSFQHTWQCLCIINLVKHSPTQPFYKQHQRQTKVCPSNLLTCIFIFPSFALNPLLQLFQLPAISFSLCNNFDVDSEKNKENGQQSS